MAKISPQLLKRVQQKLKDLTFIKRSFKASGILGPNTYQDVLDFMKTLRHNNKDKGVKINTKDGSARKK